MTGATTSQIEPITVCRYRTVMFRRQRRKSSWRERKTAPKSGNHRRRLSIRSRRLPRTTLLVGTWLIGKFTAWSWLVMALAWSPQGVDLVIHRHPVDLGAP